MAFQRWHVYRRQAIGLSSAGPASENITYVVHTVNPVNHGWWLALGVRVRLRVARSLRLVIGYRRVT